ncbi:MAG: thiol:disulfide interchange protein DsbA/DsbL [Gammaproteobacteria bacterium]|nr:thiol:disulfide interchange protein DsbA/DsbL [Gammaproteobacteria bacterium]MBU1654815.1 thiol:disulfide interchange protein DsbA/DsbL [Gammaproteobacteria bacterium]MBU1961082.1 thiol:disulfide interchange protein DsbA/DsbL [Gammaproteobacteria bacterium]
MIPVSRRDILKLCLLGLVLPLSRHAVAAIEEGFDYKQLPSPLPGDAGGKTDVLEIFWYGCPHCYQLQPLLEEWRGRHGDAIQFRRLPAALNEGWAVHARAFYTAEALGVLERIHAPFFDALHVQKRPLYDEESLAGFFEEQGVEPARFRELFHSFSVDIQVRQATGIAQ